MRLTNTLQYALETAKQVNPGSVLWKRHADRSCGRWKKGVADACAVENDPIVASP